MALWTILLGSDYRCIFDYKDQNLDVIQKEHWCINEYKTWKTSEIWPDNNLTALSDIKNKIFYFCGPEYNWEQQTGTQIILYTDIVTQIKLAELKNASFFSDIGIYRPQMKKVIDETFVESYNNIKDPSWPDISNIDDFNTLPSNIQDELKEVIGFSTINNYLERICPQYLEEPVTMQDKLNKANNAFQTAFEYNGIKVVNQLENWIHNVNHAILLQDIVKTNGNALLNPIGYDTNKQVVDFINFWVNLHPTDIQERLKNCE